MAKEGQRRLIAIVIVGRGLRDTLEKQRKLQLGETRGKSTGMKRMVTSEKKKTKLRVLGFDIGIHQHCLAKARLKRVEVA